MLENLVGPIMLEWLLKVLKFFKLDLLHAMKYNVKLRVLSSFEDLPGTYIIKGKNMEKTEISGIAHSLNEAKITLSGVPDQPGQETGNLWCPCKYSINVDMIVQSSSINTKLQIMLYHSRN